MSLIKKEIGKPMKYIVIIFTSLIFSYSSFATETPLEIIQIIFNKAMQKKFSKDVLAQKYVTDHFDFKLMSQKILKKQQPNKKEFNWFQNQIKEIVTRTVYPKATDFLSEVKTEHEIVEKGKAKFSILTLVKKRGEESEVISYFEKVGSTWRIVDISIDDESWVQNIGDQVRRTIKKKKWSGLKKSLNKRLTDLKSGKESSKNLDEE